MNKQNARLSLANAGDENPTMPRRKILLSTGGNNYRPPLERSKSAPKLFAIEEMADEEEEEEEYDDETKAKKNDEKKKLEDIRPCCKEDYLYPSITLGRRRCRRGHSIRKSRLLRGSILTQKSYPPAKLPAISIESIASKEEEEEEDNCKSLDSEYSVSSIPIEEPTRKSLGSDEDFESFLLYNNYDSKEPLAGDLMSYFDLQLQTPTASMITTTTTASMSDLLEDDMLRKNQRTSMSMSDLIDYQSDNELEEGDAESQSDAIYFNQDAILTTLRRQSKITNDENAKRQSLILAINSTDAFDSKVVQQRKEFIFTRPPVEFEDDLASESPSSLCMSEKTICVNLDSDEGSSISSGCETSSTMTTNAEEHHLPRRGSVLDRVRSYEQLAEAQVNREPIGERGASGKFYPRSATFPISLDNFVTQGGESSITKSGTLTHVDNGNVSKAIQIKHDDDSDELSDESGYVEFQDLSLKSVFA